MASEGRAKKIKEVTFKIIAVGNVDVGKSSLVKRYVTGQYDRYIENTIAVDCLNKEVTIQDQPIRVRRLGGQGGASTSSARKGGSISCRFSFRTVASRPCRSGAWDVVLNAVHEDPCSV